MFDAPYPYDDTVHADTREDAKYPKATQTTVTEIATGIYGVRIEKPLPWNLIQETNYPTWSDKACMICGTRWRGGADQCPTCQKIRERQRLLTEYEPSRVDAHVGNVTITADRHGMGFTCSIDGAPVKRLRSVTLKLEVDKSNSVTVEVIPDERGDADG
jgi:hypothetical protein